MLILVAAKCDEVQPTLYSGCSTYWEGNKRYTVAAECAWSPANAVQWQQYVLGVKPTLYSGSSMYYEWCSQRCIVAWKCSQCFTVAAVLTGSAANVVQWQPYVLGVQPTLYSGSSMCWECSQRCTVTTVCTGSAAMLYCGSSIISRQYVLCAVSAANVAQWQPYVVGVQPMLYSGSSMYWECSQRRTVAAVCTAESSQLISVAE